MQYFLLSKSSSHSHKVSHYVVLTLCALFLFSGCRSAYKNLQHSDADVNCIKQFAPQFTTTLYSAYVDVTKYHLSGILFFKLMPDSSTRVLFTNEMGVKFFDFSFAKNGDFTKHYILDKMDKKVVVKALRNDLQLVLLHPDLDKAKSLKDSTYNYVAVPTPKGNNYYITRDCEELVRIEKSSKRKSVVDVHMLNYTNGVPDSINIQHRNFKFTIALKRIER